MKAVDVIDCASPNIGHGARCLSAKPRQVPHELSDVAPRQAFLRPNVEMLPEVNIAHLLTSAILSRLGIELASFLNPKESPTG